MAASARPLPPERPRGDAASDTRLDPFAEAPNRNPFSDEPLSDNPYASPYAAGYQQPGLSRDAARSKVMGPAIALLLFALLATGFLCLGLIGAVIEAVDRPGGDGFGMAMTLTFMLVMNLVIAVGAIRMMSLKNYGLALTAAIMSLLCGLCSLLSLPFGIWALVVLCDSNVKSHFT